MELGQINYAVFASQAATFIIGMGIIWKVYLKPLGRHIDERRDNIQKDLKNAEDARKETARLQDEVKAERERLAGQAREIIEKAKADADALRSRAKEDARAEQESMIQQAKRSISQERETALREIREESAGLIIAATEKLLAANLDKKKQEKLVAKFIKELKVK